MDIVYVRSPYIQIIRKGETNIRIYNHAARQMDSISLNEYAYLEVFRTPSTINQYNQNEYADCLIKKKLLIPYDQMWNQFIFHRIEVETSTICNWKCEFCPVKTMNREAQYIDMELYKQILDKAVEYRYIKFVVLHGFNEPTIDPRFSMYVEEIIRRGLKLVLFTNGTGLNDEKIGFLKSIQQHIEHITINFPSIDEKEFEKMTGSRSYLHTRMVVDKCLATDFDTYLSIQGQNNEKGRAIKKIKEAYPKIKIFSDITFDRAGFIGDKYAQNIMVQDKRLSGCFLFSDTIFVRLNGDMQICCNDVMGDMVYGNIKNGSISQILHSDSYYDIMGKIFGSREAEDSFLCRKCVLIQNDTRKNVSI